MPAKKPTSLKPKAKPTPVERSIRMKEAYIRRLSNDIKDEEKAIAEKRTASDTRIARLRNKISETEYVIAALKAGSIKPS